MKNDLKLAVRGFGTPFTVPVVIRKNGLFFSAGEVTPDEFARMSRSHTLEVKKSTPIRAAIVQETCAKHPGHKRVYPLETYLEHGNIADYRDNYNPMTDNRPTDAVCYPLRGLMITEYPNGAVFLRKIRQEAAG